MRNSGPVAGVARLRAYDHARRRGRVSDRRLAETFAQSCGHCRRARDRSGRLHLSGLYLYAGETPSLVLPAFRVFSTCETTGAGRSNAAARRHFKNRKTDDRPRRHAPLSSSGCNTRKTRLRSPCRIRRYATHAPRVATGRRHPALGRSAGYRLGDEPSPVEKTNEIPICQLAETPPSAPANLVEFPFNQPLKRDKLSLRPTIYRLPVDRSAQRNPAYAPPLTNRNSRTPPPPSNPSSKSSTSSARWFRSIPAPSSPRSSSNPKPASSTAASPTLVEDLCLGLQAESILIERIPGKPTIGIEVPNTKREVISLRAVIESEEFRIVPRSSPSRWVRTSTAALKSRRSIRCRTL